MTITYEEVLAAAAAVVEERGPDYSYQFEEGVANCKYAINGEPSCIVGVLVNKLDAEDFPKLVEFEKKTGTSFSFYQTTATVFSGEGYGLLGVDHETPATEIRSKFSTKALAFLDTVQGAQDRGETWSDAVEYAQEITEGSYNDDE